MHILAGTAYSLYRVKFIEASMRVFLKLRQCLNQYGINRKWINIDKILPKIIFKMSIIGQQLSVFDKSVFA